MLSEHTGALLKALLPRKISPHCSSGMLYKGKAMLQLSTPVAPAVLWRTIGKLGLSLLILCQLIIGHSPECLILRHREGSIAEVGPMDIWATSL